VKRVPNGTLFDPEQIGFMLRGSVPPDLARGDFQDLPLWRQLTVRTILGLMDQYQQTLVVPMTLVNQYYFDEVVGQLQRSRADVRHFALIASPSVIRKRLRYRLDFPGSSRWAKGQIERCVAALERPEFAMHLNTDGRKVGEIVEEIIAALRHSEPSFDAA